MAREGRRAQCRFVDLTPSCIRDRRIDFIRNGQFFIFEADLFIVFLRDIIKNSNLNN